jgi:pimeloyl-ACP methyl ester carboxylesterase
VTGAPEDSGGVGGAPAATGREPRGFRFWLVRVLLGLGALLGAVLVVLFVLALIPVSTGGLGSSPDPAGNYAAAVARFDALAKAEGGVRPECRSRLLTDGRRAARVVVLFHGLTNCPRQMLELGQALHADGATVLIPRAPDHGLAGRGVGALGGVRAEDLRDYADRSIDIADGLGERVTVTGLSLGGMLAAWAAQERTDVDGVVSIAPALAVGSVPGVLATAFTNVFSRLPNLDLPSGGDSLPHAYPPGIATRPTAETFRLGTQVVQHAGAGAPATRRLAVIINDNDGTISNDRVEELVRRWRRAGRTVEVVHVPTSLGMPHDVIDSAQPGQRTALIYPVVVALTEGKTPPPIPAH